LSSDRLTNGLALGFSTDSNLMAVATEQDVIFWSLPDGEEITSLRFLNAPHPHSSPVDLEFYTDGTLLAVAGEDGSIHIFGIPPLRLKPINRQEISLQRKDKHVGKSDCYPG
jgi:WD40 repeat protein